MPEAVGTFRYPIEIAATEAGPFLSLKALVDTGATYTWIPGEILDRLGVRPRWRRRFILADGRTIERDLTEIVVRVDGATRHTVCVMGDRASDILLGSVTLESFGLAVDPLGERLIPIEVIPMLTA